MLRNPHVIQLKFEDPFWQVKCRCGARARVALSEEEAKEMIYQHRRTEGVIR